MAWRTLNDKLEMFFRQNSGVWIDGRRLSEIAGAYAWRSRVSNIRQRGLTIENRQRRVTAQGQTFTVSEYRLVLREPAQLSLIDAVEDRHV